MLNYFCNICTIFCETDFTIGKNLHGGGKVEEMGVAHGRHCDACVFIMDRFHPSRPGIDAHRLAKEKHLLHHDGPVFRR